MMKITSVMGGGVVSAITGSSSRMTASVLAMDSVRIREEMGEACAIAAGMRILRTAHTLETTIVKIAKKIDQTIGKNIVLTTAKTTVLTIAKTTAKITARNTAKITGKTTAKPIGQTTAKLIGQTIGRNIDPTTGKTIAKMTAHRINPTIAATTATPTAAATTATIKAETTSAAATTNKTTSPPEKGDKNSLPAAGAGAAAWAEADPCSSPPNATSTAGPPSATGLKVTVRPRPIPLLRTALRARACGLASTPSLGIRRTGRTISSQIKSLATCGLTTSFIASARGHRRCKRGGERGLSIVGVEKISSRLDLNL